MGSRRRNDREGPRKPVEGKRQSRIDKGLSAKKADRGEQREGNAKINERVQDAREEEEEEEVVPCSP